MMAKHGNWMGNGMAKDREAGAHGDIGAGPNRAVGALARDSWSGST